MYVILRRLLQLLYFHIDDVTAYAHISPIASSAHVYMYHLGVESLDCLLLSEQQLLASNSSHN